MELPKVKELPRFARLRQLFPHDKLHDVAGAVRDGLRAANVGERLKDGARVGISVGSRGAGGTLEIVRAIVAEVKAMGGQPFIIPAMGSHGGATPEGQRSILAHFGVTEEGVGAPIDARMETVVVGTGQDGYPAHYALAAQEADAVIVFGRTTVHPNLKAGEQSDGVASGLLKMVMIGLGKQAGAQAAHHYGLAQCILQVPALLIARSNIIAGIAIVENAYREPYRIEVVRPEEFKTSDQRQLILARSLLGSLLFTELDVLVCDRMGKDVAGSGLDPNVIGFWRFENGPAVPNYRRIVSLDLSDASLGNATGVGLNDFVTRRLANKIDPHVTWMNMLTAANKEGRTVEGYVPMVAATDREAVELAVMSIMPCAAPHICHIHDTSRLDDLMVSEALLPLARQLPSLEVVSDLEPAPFDTDGRLHWIGDVHHA